MMNDRLNGLQILRFICASLVVFNHSLIAVTDSWMQHLGSDPLPPGFEITTGGIGVHMFFGISGYIMVRTQYDRFAAPRSARDFFLRRLKRIYPIYLFATTLYLLTHLTSSRTDVTFVNYLKSILFVPYRGADGLYQPIVGQGWTLNYEMFFYAIFTLGLLAPRRVGLTLTLAGLMLLALIDMAWGDFGIFYISHQLMYFVLGGLVALVDRRWLPGVRFTAWQCWGVMLLHFLTSFEPDVVGIEHVYAWPLFHVLSAILVPVTIFVFVREVPLKPTRFNTIAVYLGDASYCTYLFHGFGIGWLKVLGGILAVSSYPPAFALAIVGVIAGNVAGVLFYRCVERPLRRVNWLALFHLPVKSA